MNLVEHMAARTALPRHRLGRVFSKAGVWVPLRVRVAALTVLLATGVLAACTSAPPSVGRSTPAQSSTTTTRVRGIPTTPVAAGPTSTVTRHCPLISQFVAQQTVGQRLDHATVRISGGKVIGCEFFPITSGYSNENLPIGGYPSAAIVITTYPSAVSARQVLALAARSGGSPSLQHVNGLVGETFQGRFYPRDGRTDWFCAFIKGPLLVTVSVAENKSQGQLIALDIARRVAPKV